MLENVYNVMYNFVTSAMGSTAMAMTSTQVAVHYFCMFFVFGFILFTLKFAKYLLFGMFGKK